jgi:exodeoxyribonuclease V beta subunit
MRQGYESGRADDPFIHAMISRTDLDPQVCLKQIQLALNDFDEAAVFTIHGFCQRTLKENGLESGISFDVELEKDMTSGWQQVAGDYWRRVSVDLSPGFLKYCKGALFPQQLLSRFHSLRPDLEIVPDARSVAGMDELEGRYQSGLRRLACLWADCREELFVLLDRQTSLKRVTYKPEKFPGWFAEMDVFFSRNGEPPKCFKNFTSSVLLKGLKKNSSPVEHQFFDLAEEVWQDWHALENAYASHLLYLQRRFYIFAEEELARFKEDKGILYFDDLLLQLQKGLADAGGKQLASQLRKKYPAVLIDEFQDTDPIQFRIFNAIHAGNKTHLLYLIGDPKQAIYNFRGADIFAYLKAASTVKSRQSLTSNYRSEEGLILAVNHLFRGKNPFLINGIGFEPALFPKINKDELCVAGDDKAHIHILFGEREPAPEGKRQKAMTVAESRNHVGVGCCAEITRLLNLGSQGQAVIGDRPVQPQDIAILVRENREACFLQRLLLQYGVASVVKDSENIFAAPQAEELFYVLKAVSCPQNGQYLIAALATDCLGWSAMELYRLQKDEEKKDDVMNRFLHYHDLWQERGFMVMFQALLYGENVRERLLSQSGGERDVTNISHLGEILHKQAVKNPAISSLLDFFEVHLQNGQSDDEFEQRLESDSRRLQILTIHKAKGLEFPIVFCPFLWSGLKNRKGDVFFHSGREKQLTLDIGSAELDSHREIARFEECAENMRLAYVALTRATNRCVVNWGGYGSFASSPLGYLLYNSDKTPVEVQEKLKACSDADLFDLANNTADSSNNTIIVRENARTIQPFMGKQSGLAVDLSCPEFQAVPDQNFQMTSFSRLTSGQQHESLIADRDQTDIRDEFSSSPGLTLFDFPRGANPGTFLHYLFEHLDFSSPGSAEAKLFIAGALVRFGYEEKWQPVLETMLNNVCRVQLPYQDFCLADIGAAQRLNELEFYFPLAEVSSFDCADLFRKHGSVGGESWYAKVENYGFQLFSGFLKGFVDLVFKQGERYFIIDWKSNYLGNHFGAYGRNAMLDSMVQSGYILQYHLYALALHRYLGTRLDDYDYERHFGGIFYVYLRGVTKKDNRTGLFWDRPSAELMADLNQLFSEKVRA